MIVCKPDCKDRTEDCHTYCEKFIIANFLNYVRVSDRSKKEMAKNECFDFRNRSICRTDGKRRVAR